ncbi:MAG TPA: hypothetical protein VM073_10740 [Usitatibacter sp.]|nr:hypothetical protein [Usitatibacter sp.]
MLRRTLLAAFALAFPAAALAVPPNACELLKPEEINLISERKVERVQPQKSGNPSECGYLDSRRGGVLTLSVREVQYAVKDEMFMERDNLEKIYRTRSKQIDAVGDAAYWVPVHHQLGFRKGKMIVTVRFATPKNQNELDTSQIARVVEARLPK